MENEVPVTPVKDNSGRAKDTMYKVAFRNQINLTSIADQKANIIISINAILISLILAIFGSGITAGNEYLAQNPVFLVPVSVMLLFTLASAVFSIMAARPKIIKKNQNLGMKESKLFFGAFSRKTLDTHLQDMAELIRSKEDIYENLAMDMYYQGIVLNKKYRYLSVAYTLFLWGIIGGITSFMAVWVFDL